MLIIAAGLGLSGVVVWDLAVLLLFKPPSWDVFLTYWPIQALVGFPVAGGAVALGRYMFRRGQKTPEAS